MSKELLQQALDALEYNHRYNTDNGDEWGYTASYLCQATTEAMQALQKALAECEAQQEQPTSQCLADFKKALECLGADDLRGIATSLFIQNKLYEKYKPDLLGAMNAKLRAEAQQEQPHIAPAGLERCEFDDKCEFCKSPEGGTFTRLNHAPEDVTEAEFYICGACVDRAIKLLKAQQEQPASEEKMPEFFAELEYNAPDFDVLVSVYRRKADAPPELFYQEKLPEQKSTEQPATPTHQAIYETIINWDEGGKRSRRELTRRIEALYAHPAPIQPAQEPVPGVAIIDDRPALVQIGKEDRYQGRLYTSPPQQQKPLSDREVELLDGMIEVRLDHATRCDHIANRTMADKQKGWDMERVVLLRKLKAHIKGDEL